MRVSEKEAAGTDTHTTEEEEVEILVGVLSIVEGRVKERKKESLERYFPGESLPL